ncbi:phosphotransferase family protein [Gordonia sp. CPCC 206044]|uniref:phosphotransferase family protein n=1 Tax=Gordonia sp. CPCC 206044 TaxID=3140793 RepID=UPI003AF35DCB
MNDTTTPTVENLATGIAAVVGTALDEPGTVSDLTRLTGGASRETWSARVRFDSGAARDVVLRRDPPGLGEVERMAAEAACLRAAAAAGVPVPELIASGDDAPGIDSPFLVTEKVAGEAIPRKLQRDPEYADARAHLAQEMGRVVGLIHRTDISTLDMLDRRDPIDVLEQMYLSFHEPRPVVESGLRWLRDHRPPRRPATLVHGDFRLGNLLVDTTGIRGVLDWELAHVGDPIEDLGWLCVRAWRFGRAEPVAGIGTRAQLLDGYEESTDTRPTSDELHWWEVFGTLRWLVLSRYQAQRHISGAEHSLELAAIGRRVCESEYDLLSVLDMLDGAAVAAAPPVVAPSTLHDRPYLTELLDLVTEALGSDILEGLGPDQARRRYQLRICLNLLGIAGREIAHGSDDEAELARALIATGQGSEAELATGIRSHAVDYADPSVRYAMSVAVIGRLRVANPRHLK